MEMGEGAGSSSAHRPCEGYCREKYSFQVNNQFYVLRWERISRVYKLDLDEKTDSIWCKLDTT